MSRLLDPRYLISLTRSGSSAKGLDCVTGGVVGVVDSIGDDSAGVGLGLYEVTEGASGIVSSGIGMREGDGVARGVGSGAGVGAMSER